MGSQNPRDGGNPSSPAYTHLSHLCEVPATVAPATPELKTRAMLLQPDHGAMRGDLRKGPPPHPFTRHRPPTLGNQKAALVTVTNI